MSSKAPLKNQVAKSMAAMYGQGNRELCMVAFHAALRAIESYEHETSKEV